MQNAGAILPPRHSSHVTRHWLPALCATRKVGTTGPVVRPLHDPDERGRSSLPWNTRYARQCDLRHFTRGFRIPSANRRPSPVSRPPPPPRPWRTWCEKISERSTPRSPPPTAKPSPRRQLPTASCQLSPFPPPLYATTTPAPLSPCPSMPGRRKSICLN